MARKRARKAQSQTDTAALATVSIGAVNYILRPPSEWTPTPEDVAADLRRIALRARMLADYIRAAHARGSVGDGEPGYMPFGHYAWSATPGLLRRLHAAFGQAQWRDATRRLEESGFPRVQQGGEWYFDAGERDVTDPDNAALRKVAFEGLEGPDVKLPDRVRLLIAPEYPELDAWTIKGALLLSRLDGWIRAAPAENVRLSDADLAELDDFASWHERWAGYVEAEGVGDGDGTRRLTTEAAREMERALTHGEKAVWDALSAKVLTGRELMDRLDTSEQTIREHVKAIRRKQGESAIGNRRGRGYFRPDAPPDWDAVKPATRARIRRA